MSLKLEDLITVLGDAVLENDQERGRQVLNCPIWGIAIMMNRLGKNGGDEDEDEMAAGQKGCALHFF